VNNVILPHNVVVACIGSKPIAEMIKAAEEAVTLHRRVFNPEEADKMDSNNEEDLKRLKKELIELTFDSNKDK
jgi:hypothetical protein